MALVKDDQRLNRIGHGGTLSGGRVIGVWHLATDDAAAVVETAGYFDAYVDSLPVGETIKASLDLDGTPVGKNYIVTANDGSTVTVAAFA